MRTFLAIELPASIQEKLQITGDELRRIIPTGAVRWVKPESIHLTIKFLGEVKPALVEQIVKLTTPVASCMRPVSLAVSGLGVFPHVSKPRVIWVGIEQIPPPLQELQRELEETFAAMGIDREKRSFNPHLTLGRVRRGTGKQDVEVLSQRLVDHQVGNLGELKASELCLFESKLSPQGASYQVLHRFPFIGGPN